MIYTIRKTAFGI